MAANKLTENQKKELLAWMCEGIPDKDILARLDQEYGITLVWNTLGFYRKKWADHIDEAEHEALEAAKRQGWGRRSNRVAAICKKIEKLDRALDDSPLASWGNLGREMREWLVQLREELHQHAPQEFSGIAGTPIEVNFGSNGRVPTTEASVD